MKVAVISKKDHCKPHLQALKSLGHKVIWLGSRPTSIPPSVEVVVLRTASCGHGGDATARSWARNTGLPLIVENGVSGIRRRMGMVDPQKIAARIFPEDVMSENFGSLTFQPPTWEDLNALLQGGSWPPWSKRMTAARFKKLGALYPEVTTLWKSLPKSQQDSFRSSWSTKANPYRSLLSLDMQKFEGRPWFFALFFLVALPPDCEYGEQFDKKDFAKQYKKVTGKMMGHEVGVAASWWARKHQPKSYGRVSYGIATIDRPIEEEASTPDMVEAAIANDPSNQADSGTGTTQARLSDIEDMVLEAMGAISDLKMRDAPNSSGDSLMNALKALKALGAKVTIEL